MWIPPQRPASCGGFTNLFSPALCLHRHCAKRLRHCEKIQRLPIPITGRRSNCLVTGNLLTERRTNMDQMKSTPAPLNLPGSPGKLNVIFHGLFGFDQETKTKEEIAVYIPNMGSAHRYKAGNWLAETTLAKGEYKLEGVTKGSTDNKLNKDRNIVLDDVAVKANPDKPPYATLRLPYPSLPIQSLRRLTIPADGLAGSTKPKVL